MVLERWPRLALSIVCLLMVAATTATMAYLVKPALDDVFIQKNVTMLHTLPFVVIAVFLLQGVAAYMNSYLMGYVGQDIIRRLREQLYNKIQDLPLSFFHRYRTGELMSRITNDVNIVKNMVTSAVTGSIKDCFSVVGLTFVIFYQIPKLAIFAFIVLPVAFFPIVYLGRKVRRYSTGCQEAVADVNAFLHETFTGAKIVRAFGRERFEKKRFAEKSDTIFFLELKEIIVRSISSPVMEFLGGLGIAFIILYGGSRVIDGTYTTGTFMSFLTAVFMLYAPVKKLSRLNNAIQKGLAATDRIFEILETKSNIREIPEPIEIPNGPHRVTLNNVWFRYDDQSMVLADINLEAKPGEVVALVGTSGGGKTSLVNLIPRFFDVTRGSVEVDGLDVRHASLDSLRRQIAIVTQEPILFNDTVRNNIAYGLAGTTQSEIEKAARAAYAHDFISTFSKGYDTPIGELGGRLSGGEKQRMCIARALLKDAPILILDEATSSLDTESEALVQKALENLMRGRTTFVIAHRLSTIGYAHRIVVIGNGRIIESGTHDELMICGGEYCKLYNMQFTG